MITPEWLWHPLGNCTGTHAEIIRCQSYNFWSGISGSNLLLPFTIWAAMFAWYKHHQCEEQKCFRFGHPHPEHGRPVCRKHFHTHVPPQGP